MPLTSTSRHSFGAKHLLWARLTADEVSSPGKQHGARAPGHLPHDYHIPPTQAAAPDPGICSHSSSLKSVYFPANPQGLKNPHEERKPLLVAILSGLTKRGWPQPLVALNFARRDFSQNSSSQSSELEKPSYLESTQAARTEWNFPFIE